jgi:uncharacterized membrane protein YphA (DoxX/SURF4 family)
MYKLQKYLTIILGVVFITSGLAKLISVDFFEQFLYSFKILNLNSAIILARLIIGTEIIIGLLYFQRINIQLLSYITLVLLFIFTGFIILIEITNYNDNCFCFGTLIQLSNKISIIKNAILSIIIIFVLKMDLKKSIKFKSKKIIISILLGLGLSFGIYFPISLFGKTNDATYCKPCFKNFIASNQLSNKKIVVCFFSNKCKYCQLAAKKISVISEKAKNQNDILYVFWDSNHNPKIFYKETKTIPFRSQEMDVLNFIKLTNGEMPLIILYNKGVIENTFRYSDINEKEIMNFLKVEISPTIE